MTTYPPWSLQRERECLLLRCSSTKISPAAISFDPTFLLGRGGLCLLPICVIEKRGVVADDPLLDPSEFKPRFPNDAELHRAGWLRPSRRLRDPAIVSSPRVGSAFWVDFAHDHYEPEFCGEHPGVVLRAVSNLSSGTCIVVPLSTAEQRALPYIHMLAENPNPKGRAEGRVAYAVCNHLYTVHVNRLRPFRTQRGSVALARVNEGDLRAIFCAVRAAMPWLAKVDEADVPPVEANAEIVTGETEGVKGEGRESSRRPILSLPKRR